MVHNCSVAGCNTSTRKTATGRCGLPEGVKIHRFPRDQKRADVWFSNIQSANGLHWKPTNTENLRVCSLHFTPDAYELNRRDGLVKLRWNAVPTIFYNNGAATSFNSDHLYSLACEDALKAEEEKKRSRKVLENIMNSHIPDHVYASPYEPPVCQIESTQSISRDEDEPTSSNSDCEIIEDESTIHSVNDYVTDTSVNPVELSPDLSISTSIGDIIVELPDGRRAKLIHVPQKQSVPIPLAKNTFTDSEVDKLQIKQLSDENRKLQAELAKVRSFAEKLLRQNERLRNSNRVTARAYRKLRQSVELSNENLSKRLNEDQIKALSKNSTRGQKWSDETLQEALALRAKCGTAVYKAISQRLPYPSVRKLQEEVQRQREELGELGEFFSSAMPSEEEDSQEDHLIPDCTFEINGVTNSD